MRIIITGAKGQLGVELMNVLSHTNPVLGMDLADHDITHPLYIDYICKFSPNLIIHSAAFTDVDGCETDPQQAYLVNAIGTRNVALACQKSKCAMVYISTDYVFDGKKKEPYHEFDQPNPLSVYGRSKLAGEQYVQTLLDHFYIVRTSWLYGPSGKNFVKTILNLAEKEDRLRVIKDQKGSPTYAPDLALALAHIIREPYYGVYHVTNQGSVSWHGFAKEILRLRGIDKKVEAITTKEFGRPAPRPANSVLQNYILELTGLYQMRPWQEALEEFLSAPSKA
jgi:dTDP-4-dehydrorhamnose reductase